MLYFDTLPKVISSDESGKLLVLTNIVTRAKILEKLQDNPMLFYTYSIQDGDTPEIIAHKYYKDPFKYWMILYSNQILDPVWQWPMDYNSLVEYCLSKYEEAAIEVGLPTYEYITGTIHHFEKIETTIDNISGQKTTKTYIVTEEVYDSLSTPTSSTYTLNDGNTVTYELDKKPVYILEYEETLNESRREIKILNETYVFRMEEQFKELMSS